MSTNPVLFAECADELVRIHIEVLYMLVRKCGPLRGDERACALALRARATVLTKTLEALELQDMAVSIAFTGRTGRQIGDECPTSEDIARAAEICAEHKLGTQE